MVSSGVTLRPTQAILFQINSNEALIRKTLSVACRPPNWDTRKQSCSRYRSWLPPMERRSASEAGNTGPASEILQPRRRPTPYPLRRTNLTHPDPNTPSNVNPTPTTTKRDDRKALMMVILFVFVDILGFSIILPLLPYYCDVFHASPSAIGCLMSSNALAQLVAAPVLGCSFLR